MLKDLFDVFYDDNIDFKNYINDTLKTNYYNYTIDKLLAEETEEIQLQQQQKNDENINITELKEIVQSLTRENESLKQENKTFLKVIELMHKKDDNGTNKIEQTIQKEIPWNVFKTNTNLRSPGKANQVKTQVELRNKFQCLQTEVETEVDFNIEEPNVEVINNSTRKRQ